MFSYYGSKSKIAHLYPEAEFPLIIEPFAGAAWYSFHNKYKIVWLNDKYEVISNIWKWIIEDADEKKLIDFSNLYSGQDISSLPLEKQHKDLLGFLINRASTEPKNIVQKWSCQSKFNPDWASTVNFSIKRIVNNLATFRNWKVTNWDYTELPDIECTWFVDPPYQFGGEHYVCNKIDYDKLRNWCLSRKGQVIVCENSKANWMNFRPLATIHGQVRKSLEVIWTNF
jgi:hypothetical protein